MKVSIALSALVALACANMASAAFDMKMSFDLIDANKDSWISQAEFTGLFQTFDNDANGLVNASEFVEHFQKTGMSLEGSLYMFYVMDANQNQTVDASEVDLFYTAFDIEADGTLSYVEYSSTMNAFLAHLAIAAAGVPRLDALFTDADANDDNVLAADEFWSLLTSADTDGDQIISKDEFVSYWRNKTWDNQNRAELTYMKFDFDGTPGIGGDLEKQTLFNAFDYGNDGVVQRQEFQFSMLNVFSQVMVNVSVELSREFQNPNLDRMVLFTSVDTDKDNAWSLDEMMASSNMSDTDGDGIISAVEYVTSRAAAGFSDGSALYMFFTADLNDDNSVDMNELKIGFQNADQNMDGSLSMDEFNRALDFASIELHLISRAVPKMAAMIWSVDVNGDDQLTVDELKVLTAAADPNGDGVINKDNFTNYWMTHTGLDDHVSSHLFEFFDPNNDGMSTEAERIALFTSFDYDKSGTVSTEEYRNSMLFLFVHVLRELKMELSMKLQGTFNQTVFFLSTDANGDGKLEPAEVNSYFTTGDLDGDGMINITEFITPYVVAGMDPKGALYIFFRLDDDLNQVLSKTEFEALFTTLDLDADKSVTMAEYYMVWSAIRYQLVEASVASERITMMFDWFDKNKDGSLTYSEFSGLFNFGDSDRSGEVSMAEFKKFWKFETGEPDDRTEWFFTHIDDDDDGFFGNDQEEQQLFDAFDYTDDNMVSKEEFVVSLLNNFARAVDALEAQNAVTALFNFFF